MEKIKTDIISFLNKEIEKLDKQINGHYSVLEEDGIGFFLQNNAGILYTLQNRRMILIHTKTDIMECTTLETREKIISYFQDKITELTEILFRKTYTNTNPMLNLMNQWLRDDLSNVRSVYKSCLNIINKHK
jgi:hypothetical protein